MRHWWVSRYGIEACKSHPEWTDNAMYASSYRDIDRSASRHDVIHVVGQSPGWFASASWLRNLTTIEHALDGSARKA